tara:strand:+ start:2249 stop:3388 length:1140 start_codon:yes stop_codon:yes gene_type:complete
MTESKLKICLVTSMHSWNDDRIFERTAIGLAALGHDVSLVAPAAKDMESEGVKILSIPVRERLGKHLYGPREAFERMKKVDADVYHFFNPNMMLKMRHWSQQGHNVFVDIHENYESRVDSLPFIPGFLKPWAVRRYRKYENKISSSFNGVTVVTQSMADKVGISGTPVLVVDNVPYLARLKDVKLAEEKADVPTIITSGSHSDARNCLNAVEALPLIVREIPNVKMKFVGRFQPKEYEKTLLDKAAELGVSEHFETAGMLPWLDNFKRISSSHIGCVFYNDNLNNRVTLPNRLYEYMYCGIAVLGEDFPEVKKVLEKTDAGRVVNSQSPSSIAEAAIELLKDKNQMVRHMKNARAAILDNYNFEKSLDELNKFYHEKSA